MNDNDFLDGFEKTLCDGLIRLLCGLGLLDALNVKLVASPDIDEIWEKAYIKDYIADAVVNFNDYPEAAISFAGFLGMAVARHWDADWIKHRDDKYKDYYGSRGFDNMDEHILCDILGLELNSAESQKINSALLSCASATLGLIQHESIETQTQRGFYILARCYTVLYKLGAAIELTRLGYKSVLVSPTTLSS